MPGSKFRSFKSDKCSSAEKLHQQQQQQRRRDPYEVLDVPRHATDQQIKSAYRKMALKFHPDKNADDPVAADVFKEVTFSYNILSDPEKRRQFDLSGFESIESDNQDLELDLSSLSTMTTMFAALFSKLGVPIKTTVSASILEEALNGSVEVCQLQLGQTISRKVEKQSAHFYSVAISEKEASMGLVVRAHSTQKRKFKLLYFELEENGGLSLALQEDSIKTGKASSAGMFFLGFPVYRFERNSSITAAKDPDSAFFKRLSGFEACEINELKAGTHIFAIYGDNFFKSSSYTIEIMCAEPFSAEKEKLRDVEAKLLTKRAELSKFESEYREVLAKFTEMTSRYAREMKEIDELLKERNAIHASYTTNPQTKQSDSSSSSSSMERTPSQESNGEDNNTGRKEKKRRSRTKKKWFHIPLKMDKRKPC